METQTITTRVALIEHTTREFQKFARAVDSLPDEVWTGPTDPAGWSVKDHVANVTQWDLALTELFRRGTPLQQTLESPDGEWNVDYTSINERLRQRTIDDTVEQVRADRDAAWSALIDAVGDLADEQLATPAEEIGINVEKGDRTPLLPILVLYLGGHYAAHADMIRVIAEGSKSS